MGGSAGEPVRDPFRFTIVEAYYILIDPIDIDGFNHVTGRGYESLYHSYRYAQDRLYLNTTQFSWL